jgi:hypothetical protein
MRTITELEGTRSAGRPLPGGDAGGAASRLLPGALGGLVATLPMTVVMKILQRAGRGRRRLPFPPHEVTMGVVETAGVGRHHLSREARTALTYAGHFGYGAAAGAAYPLLTRPLPGRAAARGAAYGLAVWAGSYLGFLPSLGLWGPRRDQAASRRAARTTILLVLAHLVWGTVLGLVHEALAVPRRRR